MGGDLMSNEKKVESAIPVQSRIDIMALAEMAIYWESIGKGVKTMSQLVNWSVDLCSQILRANDKVREVDSLFDAHNILIDRGLYQSKVMERGRKKFIKGRQLENLRLEGVYPESGGVEGRREYVSLHNRHSLQSAPEMFNKPLNSKYNEMHKEMDKLEKEKAQKIRDENKKLMDELLVDDQGRFVIEPHGRGNYTEADRLRDEQRKKYKVDPNVLVKECEKIVEDSVNVNRSYRPLTDNELDERDRKRMEKERLEKEALDAMVYGARPTE